MKPDSSALDSLSVLPFLNDLTVIANLKLELDISQRPQILTQIFALWKDDDVFDKALVPSRKTERHSNKQCNGDEESKIALSTEKKISQDHFQTF